jgi:hypothetical protein
MGQIISDNREDVAELQGVIYADDLLGRGSALVGTNDQLQQNATLADAKDARRFLA